ncbi:MAG TPA: hypothetical protein VE130_07335 [Nitrososphaeraceae archaeon]|jgi:hypothetical protein|nr:hypothetical protein [Nitrososphaeraceae archaeon]
MTDYASLDEVLLLPTRKLVVASNEIDLSKSQDCTVFVLLVEESFGSAGGRAAGSGSRRIGRILGFRMHESRMDLIIDSHDMEIIDRFDVPYSAVALDIVLSNGQKAVVQGLVDSVLIKDYLRTINTVV